MMKLGAFLAFLLGGGGAASAATLIVDSSGILTGATDVVVDGALYDVTFAGGSCNAVFGNCATPDFLTFTDSAGATAAALALLDQVLIDGPLGNFQSNPLLVAFCTRADCVVATPLSSTVNRVSD